MIDERSTAVSFTRQIGERDAVPTNNGNSNRVKIEQKRIEKYCCNVKNRTLSGEKAKIRLSITKKGCIFSSI